MLGKSEKFEEPIGIKQFDLVNTYQQGEAIKFYIEQSGKYAFAKAIYEQFAEKRPGCGEYLGYPFWQSSNLKCYPQSELLRRDLELGLSDHMATYLDNYPLLTLTADNFDLVLQENAIVARPIAPISIPVGSAGAAEYVQQYFKGKLLDSPDAAAIDTYLRNNNYPLAGLGGCIIQAESQTGVHSLVILSIALHESNNGYSGLAQKGKNLFGIKCTQSYKDNWCTFSDKTQCCRSWDKSKLDLIYEPNDPNSYRIYKDWCESINDFARMISTASHYSPAMEHKDNPEEMVVLIKEGGYATNPAWSDNVIARMRTAYNEIETAIA